MGECTCIECKKPANSWVCDECIKKRSDKKMLPEHYIKAMKNIKNAMSDLYCADDELKTVEIYLDLQKVIDKLNYR